MLKTLQKRKSEGFTIIEVLVVLAIAGLIMVVVFLAVPALQRVAEVVGGEVPHRRPEVHAIEQIERFCPEFERLRPRHAEPLEEREIDIPLVVAAQDAAFGR